MPRMRSPQELLRGTRRELLRRSSHSSLPYRRSRHIALTYRGRICGLFFHLPFPCTTIPVRSGMTPLASYARAPPAPRRQSCLAPPSAPVTPHHPSTAPLLPVAIEPRARALRQSRLNPGSVPSPASRHRAPPVPRAPAMPRPSVAVCVLRSRTAGACSPALPRAAICSSCAPSPEYRPAAAYDH